MLPDANIKIASKITTVTFVQSFIHFILSNKASPLHNIGKNDPSAVAHKLGLGLLRLIKEHI